MAVLENSTCMNCFCLWF